MGGREITNIISGMGLLIGIYLVLSHGTNSAKILSTISQSSVSAIKALQGR